MRVTDSLLIALQKIANVLSLNINSLELRMGPVPSYMTKSEQAKVTIMHGKIMIATFSLVTLPGCCGIIVSTGSTVMAPYRKKGIGRILAKARIELARDYGYSMIICTDVSDNIPQQKILKELNWIEVSEFINARTSNKIKLHYIKL